jgi:diadenosine tetraphosphate (Ap4A) HIT family hydrolase
MPTFEIHQQLLADCHRIGKFALCYVLLHKNAAVPWIILVPETTTEDLLDLPEEMQNRAMKEASIVSDFIKKHFSRSKVNFASIGNVVTQLHLHIVARKPGDPCWPAPVWGYLQETHEYSLAEVRDIGDQLMGYYSMQGK